MKKKQPADSQFRTHIAEPRWQQIASVGLVLLLVLGWVVLWIGG